MKKHRFYPIEKSPLYRLRNRGKLANMLDLPSNYFRRNYRRNIQYSVVTRYTGRNKKERIIQRPSYDLKKIQKGILKYLSRIETPDWLISGKKGRSYIDNAKFHESYNYVTTSDISNFYPSCKRKDIFKMFRYTFKMQPDIAGIITDLVAFEQSLPTGAPTSQLVAFWTYKDIFVNINEIANTYDATFTLYVDDMTFSCENPLPNKLINQVDSELKKVGLELKKQKTKFYGKNDFKIITGVAADVNGSLKVPNRLRKDIIEGFIQFKNLSGEEKEKKRISVLGKIYSARQIEPTIFPEVYRQIK